MSEVVARSITNACLDQGLKTLCGFFLQVVARSIINACPNQVLKTLCWFFPEVVARSITNACPDQVLKTLCWFFSHKLLLGQEPMFDQEHLDDYNLIYFAP